MIPAESSASFVCRMEQVLDLYEQPYDADYPVVCPDESPKQLLDYEQFTTSSSQRCRDSEYVRRGMVELFVATESLRGWRCLSVEADHKTAIWVQFVARQMDTTYRAAKKVRWVMDNLSTHKRSFFHAHFSPAVAQTCLRRMEIIYTPAHGSWLNIAKIEFSVLSRQVLDQPLELFLNTKKPIIGGHAYSGTSLFTTSKPWWNSGRSARMRSPGHVTGNSKQPMPVSNQLNFTQLFNVFQPLATRYE